MSELRDRVAWTARAVAEHDWACRDYACLMRDGCPERSALMRAANATMNEWADAEPRPEGASGGASVGASQPPTDKPTDGTVGGHE